MNCQVFVDPSKIMVDFSACGFPVGKLMFTDECGVNWFKFDIPKFWIFLDLELSSMCK